MASAAQISEALAEERSPRPERAEENDDAVDTGPGDRVFALFGRDKWWGGTVVKTSGAGEELRLDVVFDDGVEQNVLACDVSTAPPPGLKPAAAGPNAAARKLVAACREPAADAVAANAGPDERAKAAAPPPPKRSSSASVAAPLTGGHSPSDDDAAPAPAPPTKRPKTIAEPTTDPDDVTLDEMRATAAVPPAPPAVDPPASAAPPPPAKAEDLPAFRSAGPRVGETIWRKVERPGGTAWAEGKIIGYLGPDESDFVGANGAKVALYRVRYDCGLRELVGDEEDLEEWEVRESYAPRDRPPLNEEGRAADASDGAEFSRRDGLNDGVYDDASDGADDASDGDGDALGAWAPFTPRAAPAPAPAAAPPRAALPTWAPLDVPATQRRPDAAAPVEPQQKKRPHDAPDDASAGSLEAELTGLGRDSGSDSEGDFVPGALDADTLAALGLVTR